MAAAIRRAIIASGTLAGGAGPAARRRRAGRAAMGAIQAPPATIIAIEISCGWVSPATTSSLRRMNSTRNRSVPANTAHRANSVPGLKRCRQRHSSTQTAPMTIVS